MTATSRIAAARGLIVALTFGMVWGLAAQVEAQSPTLSVVGRDTTKTNTQDRKSVV